MYKPKFVKILTKTCLRKGCNNKAIHFGFNGKKYNGLCDECYNDFKNIRVKLEDIISKLHAKTISNNSSDKN